MRIRIPNTGLQRLRPDVLLAALLPPLHDLLPLLAHSPGLTPAPTSTAASTSTWNGTNLTLSKDNWRKPWHSPWKADKRQTTANQKAYKKPESKTCVTKSTNTGRRPAESNQHPSKFIVTTTSSTVGYVFTTPLPGILDTFNQVTQVNSSGSVGSYTILLSSDADPFLGLLDPDPLVRGTYADPAQDPDPSIIKQKSQKQ